MCHNRKFIKSISRQEMICAGCRLDAQQSEAIVACEDAQLVLASAGSGKSLSLLGKIGYLHKELNIQPEQILAISFTQKTVTELKERCSVKGVEIKTFHSLGNNILHFSEHPSLGARRLISDVETATFIKNYCEFLIKNDEAFARNFIDYLLFFFSAPSSPGDVKNHANRISFNRLYLRLSLQNAPNEHIRVKDEQLIANWLYVHSLKYAYNQEYPFSETKYKVTYTLELPQIIYIDYLIIDQKGHSIYGANYLRDAK